MLVPSALTHLIEPVARRTRHASRGKQFFVKSFDLFFQSATIFVLTYMFVQNKRNTLWLRDTVRQSSVGKSAARADLREVSGRGSQRPLPDDVCLTVSPDPKVFIFYQSKRTVEYVVHNGTVSIPVHNVLNHRRLDCLLNRYFRRR